jgi:hypothetical protein
MLALSIGLAPLFHLSLNIPYDRAPSSLPDFMPLMALRSLSSVFLGEDAGRETNSLRAHVPPSCNSHMSLSGLLALLLEGQG